MSEIIQLYKDSNKTIKVYPKTVASEVYIDEENNIIQELDKFNSSLDTIVYKTFKRQQYGKIELPEDFYKVNINLVRGLDGKVRHDFKINDYLNAEFDKILYFDTVNGNDVTGDGTISNRYRTLYKCFEEIKSSELNKFKIVGKNNLFREEFNTSTINLSNKFVVITTENEEKIICSGSQSSTRKSGYNPNGMSGILEWTLHENGIYKTTRSATKLVFDLKNRDFQEVGQPLKRVSSLEELQENTWYTDKANVYVKTYDNRKPDDTILILMEIMPMPSFNLINSTLFIENYEFYCAGNKVDGAYTDGTFVVNGDENSKFINHNCVFTGGDNGTVGIHNGLSIRNIKECYSINSICAYCLRDGFNYHYYGVEASERRNRLVYEYNCIGYECGYGSVNNNNNASTCHEGCSILRIGDVGFNTVGPICADVNGCYTICIDCNFDNSLANLGDQNTSYFFDNSSIDLNNNVVGKAYLINCGGESESYSIMGGSGFSVYLSGFYNINKIRGALNINYV